MQPLNNKTIGNLPDTVRVPRYDRSGLTPGIVHIGVGNFHRAHQSWYLHRLFDAGLDQDWAIIGAGVRAFDAAQRDKLLAQDCLTTLIELDPSGTSAEVVGSMIGYLPIEEGNAALIAKIAEPRIRIVSLTVTEGGYYIHPATKAFDADNPDIRQDAATPDRPRTAFGAIIAALKQRRDRGIGPLTLMSCDNLQGNGAILRQTVVSLARLSDPELADWIGERCSFPNSMVDCIVPATGPKEIALAEQIGIADQVPVTHENFRQWVIEDDFCAGRPEWDKAGATFTDHVHDYERMKIRLLNAGHQLLANSAEVLSVPTISAAMDHPLIGAFFRKTASREIAPHVAAVPDMPPEAYIDLISKRFSNPAIVDTTRRVAFDGSSRHTGFVLPTIRDALAAGAPIQGLALGEAAWARMCAGTREDGSEIEPNDPFWADLVATAREARTRPHAWLEQSHTYGAIANDAGFAEAFDHWLKMIWNDGLETALTFYLSGS
ncbi:mannitol dehydrogenase family protein [Roseibium sp. RKSG952]|uniref:mannitol dehydrogenase family protein n=1 Tax=Roseibium sp. RKSG952 TaxID=2529384 RepID=UPI0012BC2253|nr:mannitol dehydrogenase family protein [Roseibium sp. RKSG952]MTH96068.1 mannitol dehydrogenase family protein [Roseibium sp. RKSG952]